MNDDQRLLANAYLDGEVTADEQARAEGDPEVVAEVSRIRAVREAMRVTERPDAARRDAAVRAALDAFEVRPAATIATTPDLPAAPPASLAARRQARWLRPLSAAAALVLVIGGGVLVLRDGGQERDDAASSAPEAPQELSATVTEVATAQDSDEADSAAAPADTAPAEGAGELAAPAATAAGTSVLTSPADLAAFAIAAMAVDARTATESESACALGEWVGAVVYQRDGEQLTVHVFVDAGEAIAADPASCEVVARAQLP